MTAAIAMLVLVTVGLLAVALGAAYSVGVHDGRVMERDEHAANLERRDRVFTTSTSPRVLR